jgi:hypothetical protein
MAETEFDAQPITTLFRREQAEAIRRLAEVQDRSLSGTVRYLVSRALATQGSRQDVERPAASPRGSA